MKLLHVALSLLQLSLARQTRSMPPNAGSAEGIILGYINEQNRPLNVQNIADALQVHGIKKSSVQKVLDTLSENETISSKDYGKQKVYLAKQEQFGTPDPEELEHMTRDINELQEQVVAKRAKIHELESERRSMAADLTDGQIADRVSLLTDEMLDMESKLSKLTSGVLLVTAEDKTAVEESYASKVSLWRKRKHMFKDLMDMLAEAVPTNLKQFKEDLGIETDDDVGIRMEDYSNLSVKKRKCA